MQRVFSFLSPVTFLMFSTDCGYFEAFKTRQIGSQVFPLPFLVMFFLSTGTRRSHYFEAPTSSSQHPGHIVKIKHILKQKKKNLFQLWREPSLTALCQMFPWVPM